jgi:hypothetical protein
MQEVEEVRMDFCQYLEKKKINPEAFPSSTPVLRLG